MLSFLTTLLSIWHMEEDDTAERIIILYTKYMLKNESEGSLSSILWKSDFF